MCIRDRHTTIEKLFRLALSSFTAHRQIGNHLDLIWKHKSIYIMIVIFRYKFSMLNKKLKKKVMSNEVSDKSKVAVRNVDYSMLDHQG